MDQLHGPRPVGDLIVQIIGDASSLQLQLLGLERRLRRRLWKQETKQMYFFFFRGSVLGAFGLFRLYVALTLQDVHPDQFRPLRASPDLPLEVVLSLTEENMLRITPLDL